MSEKVTLWSFISRISTLLNLSSCYSLPISLSKSSPSKSPTPQKKLCHFHPSDPPSNPSSFAHASSAPPQSPNTVDLYFKASLPMCISSFLFPLSATKFTWFSWLNCWQTQTFPLLLHAINNHQDFPLKTFWCPLSIIHHLVSKRHVHTLSTARPLPRT